MPTVPTKPIIRFAVRGFAVSRQMLNMHIPIRLLSLFLGGFLLSANSGLAQPNAADAPIASKSDVSGHNKEPAKKEEAKRPGRLRSPTPRNADTDEKQRDDRAASA